MQYELFTSLNAHQIYTHINASSARRPQCQCNRRTNHCGVVMSFGRRCGAARRLRAQPRQPAHSTWRQSAAASAAAPPDRTKSRRRCPRPRCARPTPTCAHVSGNGNTLSRRGVSSNCFKPLATAAAKNSSCSRVAAAGAAAAAASTTPQLRWQKRKKTPSAPSPVVPRTRPHDVARAHSGDPAALRRRRLFPRRAAQP